MIFIQWGTKNCPYLLTVPSFYSHLNLILILFASLYPIISSLCSQLLYTVGSILECGNIARLTSLKNHTPSLTSYQLLIAQQLVVELCTFLLM